MTGNQQRLIKEKPKGLLRECLSQGALDRRVHSPFEGSPAEGFSKQG